MATLIEYLDVETLGNLAEMFSSAAGSPVRILSPDGELLACPEQVEGAGKPDQKGQSAETKVLVAGEHVGTISLACAGESAPLVELMREVVVRLCEQAGQIRSRIEELSAVYRMTSAFGERRDLKEILQLVAETMVAVTGADACSIRVFNEERTELLRMAAFGLSGEYTAKGPIRLADSRIDQEVLAAGDCVYIADERADERVLYKTEAKRENLVSALCVPMNYRGRVEGIIRVYTRRPHRFDWFETSLIRGVASQAAIAVVNSRLYDEALLAERIRRHLRLAGDVQKRMIPAEPPKIRGLDVAGIYVPCFELGGDFYDFIKLPGGKLGVCVADVVGKGVRASLLMASTRSALRAHAAHLADLSEILSAVNTDLWRESEMGDFVTLFFGVLDPKNKTLTYCSAGHEPVLLARDGQAPGPVGVRELPGGSGVLGMDEQMQFRQETLNLESGDVLIIFTDGLPEAINFQDEVFGRKRVHNAVLEACRQRRTAKGIGKFVLWEMRRFAGLQTRCDDLTLVTIKIRD